MWLYKEVTLGDGVNSKTRVRGAIQNDDDVQITFVNYYEPDSCAMFFYKMIYQGNPIEFCFAGVATDDTAEHRTWIGPVCDIILPFHRVGVDRGDFIKSLSFDEKQKIRENVTYAVLHFEQFKGANPPYPEAVVFSDLAKEYLDIA